MWFRIVGRVLQKGLTFLCEGEHTWSCTLMRIAIRVALKDRRSDFV